MGTDARSPVRGVFLFLEVVAAVVAGPVIGVVVGRRPGARMPLALGTSAAIGLAWLAVTLPSAPVPFAVLAVFVVVVAVGGPTSLVAFDVARSCTPPRRLGTATGFVNTGGFVGALATMLVVGLEGNRVVNLECTWSLLAQRDRQYLNLMGTAGSGSLSPLAVFKDMPAGLVEATPAIPATRENLFTASYRNELAQFVEVVRGERAPAPPQEHLVLMRVVEAAYRSAQERREIAL